MSVLKPCPFCGKKVQDVIVFVESAYRKAKTLGVKYRGVIECACCKFEIRRYGDKNGNKVIKKWNQRS